MSREPRSRVFEGRSTAVCFYRLETGFAISTLSLLLSFDVIRRGKCECDHHVTATASTAEQLTRFCSVSNQENTVFVSRKRIPVRRRLETKFSSRQLRPLFPPVYLKMQCNFVSPNALQITIVCKYSEYFPLPAAKQCASIVASAAIVAVEGDMRGSIAAELIGELPLVAHCAPTRAGTGREKLARTIAIGACFMGCERRTCERADCGH